MSWKTIADNLKKASWSWGYVSAIASEGEQMWIVWLDSNFIRGRINFRGGNIDFVRSLPRVFDTTNIGFGDARPYSKNDSFQIR